VPQPDEPDAPDEPDEPKLPPPPAAALLAAVARGGPVTTRRPVRTLAAVVGLSLGWAARLVLVKGLRADLSALPVVYALVCLAGFIAQLAFALVPSPRMVLPSGHDSARSSVLILLITVPLALAVAARVSGSPGPWAAAPWSWRAAMACAGGGLAVATAPALLCLRVLRRLVPGGSWRVSLAVGAGAGVLSGLTLPLHCPDQGAVHLALAHGSAMLLPPALLLLQVRR
jgi:hypothetical protein